MNLLSVVKWVITIWVLVIAPATCDITFDLNKPNSYGKFVEEVRNEIKDAKITYFGIPIIKAKPPKKFLYIEVKVNKNGQKPAMSVTLQLTTAALYVVAYRDKDPADKYRYFYFTKSDVKTNEIFPDDGEKTLIPMKCDHDYASILSKSNKEIKDLLFQLPKLEEAMRNAYGKEIEKNEKNFAKRQASFLLYSILMTSEAARFKYIEQKTVDKQKSDVKVASLVNLWDTLSTQIIGADKKTGKFKQTISIKTSETKSDPIEKVADIKSDMGILLNKIKK